MPTRDLAPAGAPCWIDLMTSDPAKARAFYTGLFGWKAEDPNPDFGGYSNFSKDGVLVAGCMQSTPGEGVSDTWSVYLAVDDAQATSDAALAAGGGVHLPPMQVGPLGTMGMLGDAGGASIGIWQPGEHKGFGVLAEANAPAWFELHTRDYDASVAFYRTAFGWDAHTMSETEEFRYTTLGEGEAALAGIMDAAAILPEGTPAHWAVYFGVDDTDKAVARVEELGGAVTSPPQDSPYGRLASATDSTGAALNFMSLS
jgi:predicted enzyme related to lactoylglutathione lyase